MKYILYTLAVIVAIPILIYTIGSILPVKHTATVSKTYTNSKGELWNAITGISDFPEWRASVEDVEILSDSTEKMRWTEFYHGSSPVTFEEESRRDSSLIVVRIATENIPFGGTWTYRLIDEENGTKLAITENGELYNPLFRFMAKFIFGHNATLNQYHEALEKRLVGST